MRPIIWTNRLAALLAGLVTAWLASIELGTSRTASRTAAETDDSADIVVDTSTSRLFDAVAAIAMSSGIAASLVSPIGSFKRQRSMFLAGITVLVAAGKLSGFARRHLGRFHRDSLTVHADHSLVDTGPYQHVRHPLYVATIGVLWGIGAVLGNWISLGVANLPIAAVVHRIRVEEQMLVDALGNDYVEYQTRTARLVPGIW